VKKPDVIQKNELYFCNQGSNVIQNQLSKSKHRLKSFVLQACVINAAVQCHILRTFEEKSLIKLFIKKLKQFDFFYNSMDFYKCSGYNISSDEINL
jgi:hypothetical protein